MGKDIKTWKDRPLWVFLEKWKLLLGITTTVLVIYFVFFPKSDGIPKKEKMFIQQYFSTIESKNIEKIISYYCQDSVICFFNIDNPSIIDIKNEMKNNFNNTKTISHDILWEKSAIDELPNGTKKYRLFINYKGNKSIIKKNVPFTIILNKDCKIIKVTSF